MRCTCGAGRDDYGDCLKGSVDCLKGSVESMHAVIDRLTSHLSARQGDHEAAKQWQAVCEWCEAKGLRAGEEGMKDFLERITAPRSEDQAEIARLRAENEQLKAALALRGIDPHKPIEWGGRGVLDCPQIT